ncbi:MAG: hypothetical protein ABJE95_16575 [Byssovorax sp.]
MILRRPLAALIFTALLAPSVAFAEASDADRATARTLAGEGQDALEKKDFTTAADRFTRADSIIHAPTLQLGLAHAQVGLGKLVSAQETYNRIVREGVAPGSPPTWPVAVETARKEVEALAPRVPQVIINVKGTSSPRVTLDDAVVPTAALGVKRPADPGTHLIRAVAEGFAPAESSVTLREGATGTVTLELKAAATARPPVAAVVPPTATAPPVAAPLPPSTPSPASSGSTQKTLGFVALGVGGAGLVLGAVTGGLAIGKHGDLATSCPKGCPPSSQAELDSYHTLAALSTVGFILGGAGAAAGTILLLTAPKKSASEPRVTPVLGLGYLGAKGTF